MAIVLKKEGIAVYVSRGPKKGELVADPHLREQAAMLTELNRLGYMARFGKGFEQTRRLVDWYMQPNYKQPINGELF